ncbi:hypothetical protein EVAR_66669_1 [Eumeta japonica]|uniref:Uncharacterized protein n=1 Tax=Eumeta variegata TaxID=151549 RepID=A0A4C1ZCX7_EUMVA|nr:hypothetical protein EVAR_66669_1 [Eumeta japonica]
MPEDSAGRGEGALTRSVTRRCAHSFARAAAAWRRYLHFAR